MLLDEFNDKSDFDDLGAPTTASTAATTASTNSIANSGPPRTTSADLNNSSNNPGKLPAVCLLICLPFLKSQKQYFTYTFVYFSVCL